MIETLPLSTSTTSCFKSILTSLETGVSLIKNYIYLHRNNEGELISFFEMSDLKELELLKKHATLYSIDQLDYTTQEIFQFFENLAEQPIADSEVINTLKSFFNILSENITDGNFFSDPCILPCKHTLNSQTANKLNPKKCPYDREIFSADDLKKNEILAFLIKKTLSLLPLIKEQLKENLNILTAYSQLELPLKHIGIISTAERLDILQLLIKNKCFDLIKQFADHFVFLDRNSNEQLTHGQHNELLIITRKTRDEEIAIFVCTKIIKLLPIDYTNFFLWALENKFHGFMSVVIPEHYRIPYQYYIQAVMNAVHSNFDTQLSKLLTLYNFPEFTTALLQQFKLIVSSIPTTHQESLHQLIIALSTQEFFLQDSWKNIFANTLQLAELISNPNVNEIATTKVVNIFMLKLSKTTPESGMLVSIKKLVKYIFDREYFVEKITHLNKLSPQPLYQKFYKNLGHIFTLRMAEIIIFKEPHHAKEILAQKTQESVFLYQYKRSYGFWPLPRPKLVEILNIESHEDQLQEFLAEDQLFNSLINY